MKSVYNESLDKLIAQVENEDSNLVVQVRRYGEHEPKLIIGRTFGKDGKGFNRLAKLSIDETGDLIDALATLAEMGLFGEDEDDEDDGDDESEDSEDDGTGGEL